MSDFSLQGSTICKGKKLYKHLQVRRNQANAVNNGANVPVLKYVADKDGFALHINT